jgi:hypothetical protein
MGTSKVISNGSGAQLAYQAAPKIIGWIIAFAFYPDMLIVIWKSQNGTFGAFGWYMLLKTQKRCQQQTKLPFTFLCCIGWRKSTCIMEYLNQFILLDYNHGCHIGHPKEITCSKRTKRKEGRTCHFVF